MSQNHPPRQILLSSKRSPSTAGLQSCSSAQGSSSKSVSVSRGTPNSGTSTIQGSGIAKVPGVQDGESGAVPTAVDAERERRSFLKSDSGEEAAVARISAAGGSATRITTAAASNAGSTAAPEDFQHYARRTSSVQIHERGKVTNGGSAAGEPLALHNRWNVTDEGVGNATLMGNYSASIDMSWVVLTQPMCDRICSKLRQTKEDGGGDRSELGIRCLALLDNQITPAQCVQLASSLEAASDSIRMVSLGYNNIGKVGCDALVSLVNVSSKLTVLDLRGNDLVHTDVRRLIRGVALSTSIRRLGLAGNKLGVEGMELLLKALEKNTYLTALDVSQNDIGPRGAAFIADILQMPTCSLEELLLYNNRLGPGGTVRLMSALQANQRLRVLNIGNNNITNKAAESIGQMLSENTALRSLDLRLNTITDIGMGAIAANGLAVNGTLTSLRLCGNPIGPSGMDFIVKAFIHNQRCQIQEIDLSHCSLGPVGGMRVANMVAVTASLVSLNLSSNELDDEAATAIARSLLESALLSSIDLSSNRFGELGAISLIEAVQMNAQIVSMVLSGNDISRVVQKKVDGLLELRRARRVNPR